MEDLGNYKRRLGYFRRSKNGDYLKQDDMFVRVHPGEGTHIWIPPKYIKVKEKSKTK